MGLFGRQMTVEEYANEWLMQARAFRARADYRWMATMLGAASRVLEVGCGGGESTVAILKSAPRGVIVVERNPRLFAMARKNIGEMGYVFREVAPGEAIPAPAPREVVAILGSVDDEALASRLAAIEVDAIACWLIGAEPGAIAKSLFTEVDQFQGDEMPRYRWHVHRHCYGLGNRVLPPGQVVHLVDRLGIPTSEMESEHASDHVAEHAAAAGSGYDIQVSDTAMLRLPNTFNKSAIQYVADREPGPVARVPVLISLRARRC